MNTKDSRPAQADNGTYCAFEVGQHVVLVDDNWPAHRIDARVVTRPVRGVVYTIRWIGIGSSGIPSILLAEIVNAPRSYIGGVSEACWRARRFRPLQKLKVEDFMSADAPVKVGEPA